MLLTYQNLKIRDAAPEDAQQLCEWWNDGRVMAHAGFPQGIHTTPEEVARQLLPDSDDTFRRLILEVDGTPTGELCVRNHGGGTAEIGIKICDLPQQGRGCGTLALQMLLTHLFARGYRRVILDTDLENARAQHVYEKLGFRRLRVNRDVWTNQMGEPRSSVDYELLPPQFTPLE